jgi:hypothetical protein
VSGERGSRVANSNLGLIDFTFPSFTFGDVRTPPSTVSRARATVDLGDPSRRATNSPRSRIPLTLTRVAPPVDSRVSGRASC